MSCEVLVLVVFFRKVTIDAVLSVMCCLLITIYYDQFVDQTKVAVQYFPLALFIVLYKVVLTFEFVNDILNDAHLNES